MTRETPTMPVHGGFNFPHPKSERKKHLHVVLKKAPCCCNWILIPRVSFTKHSPQPGAHSPEICFSQVMCKSGARIKKQCRYNRETSGKTGQGPHFHFLHMLNNPYHLRNTRAIRKKLGDRP